MSQKAVVTSLEAIEDFRSNLVLYLSKARPALEEASAEVFRVRSWIQNEQRTFWESQVRRRAKELEEAQQALFGARISFLQGESSAEVMGVQKAKRALEEANNKLRIVKQWSRDYDNRIQPLAKQMEKLQTVLAHDMALAVASLTETLKSLDAYARIPPPGLAMGSSSASTPPEGGPPRTEKADPA
jgi:chromosome segregation ATPase